MSLDEKNKIKYYFSNCIYGNIEEFNYEKENIQIILISRRYLWNYGIYSYRRGLSKYGGNSNQIEIELILIHNKKEIYSNIHLSSYIPIYYTPQKLILGPFFEGREIQPTFKNILAKAVLNPINYIGVFNL